MEEDHLKDEKREYLMSTQLGELYLSLLAGVGKLAGIVEKTQKYLASELGNN